MDNRRGRPTHIDQPLTGPSPEDHSPAEPRAGRFRFSLFVLLTLIALVAVWTAVGMAYQKNADLRQKHEALQRLSGRLKLSDDGELAYAQAPQVTDDFSTWEVHIPSDDEYELRLGVGSISAAGIPMPFESVTLEPGRHRVTAQVADNLHDGYRYVIYVDGEPVIEKAMGADWMPAGWQQASSSSWPERFRQEGQQTLQLAARSYTSRVSSKTGRFFGSNSDETVTRPGYRLWVDSAGSEYKPASPFVDMSNSHTYRGIGLRDGLRLQPNRNKQFVWRISRPASRNSGAVFDMNAQFLVDGQVVLSDQTRAFKRWHLLSTASGSARSVARADWQLESDATVLTAFLHAEVNSPNAIEPVVELRWDATRPGDVGLRLADTPANATLDRIRLQISGSNEHLWRMFSLGNGWLDVRNDLKQAGKIAASVEDKLSVAIELPEGDPNILFRWKTDVAGPLQFQQSARNQSNPYAGIDLYNGLPLEFALEVPNALKPKLTILAASSHPSNADASMPQGETIDELQLDVESKLGEWIWISAVPPRDWQK